MDGISDESTIVRVKVQPRASRDEITGSEEGLVKVKVTAPPVGGKANKALKQLLARRLGISKGRVEILSGERSREKRVQISGIAPEEMWRRLGGKP